MELSQGGHTPVHILKSRLISLVIRYVDYRRGASRTLPDQFGQGLDAHLMICADINNLSHRLIRPRQAQNRLHATLYIAKTAALFAAAKAGQREGSEPLADERRHD